MTCTTRVMKRLSYREKKKRKMNSRGDLNGQLQYVQEENVFVFVKLIILEIT